MRRFKPSKAFTLIEPGPAVLVTTQDEKKNNVMTISWTMVPDFTPVFAITTGSWNHSFAAWQKNGECVIAIPTVDRLDLVVGTGTCSGSDTDKFAGFNFTPVHGRFVRAPDRGVPGQTRVQGRRRRREAQSRRGPGSCRVQGFRAQGTSESGVTVHQ